MTRVDVVVIGAGLAGLTAALALDDAGFDVLVLEADDRVGGRTESVDTPAGRLELGGQWVGPEHRVVLELVDRLGLATFTPAADGDSVVEIAGRRHIGDAADLGLRHLAPDAIADVRKAVAQLGELAASVDLAAPWATPGAERLDEQTFATWIRAVTTSEAARRHLLRACDFLFVPDPAEVSLLHAAHYFASGAHGPGLVGGHSAQDLRIVEGAAAISAGIADRLGPRVRLRAPVRRLIQDGEHVVAVTRNGERVEATQAIVTLPPPLAARLEYDPPLPSARDQLTQRLHTISVVKLQLVYLRPFWRDAGLSGHALSDVGPVRQIVDNSAPDVSDEDAPGNGGAGDGGPGVLVTFIEGADKRGFAQDSPPSRRAAFTDAVTRLLGPGPEPIDYVEKDWSAEEFTRGCYAGHAAPSTWTGYGPALTTPVERLHWAGTETSAIWTGYLEGAARSGRKAAEDVGHALGR